MLHIERYVTNMDKTITLCVLIGVQCVSVYSQKADELRYIARQGQPKAIHSFEETPTCSSYQSLCKISMNITQLTYGRIPTHTIPHTRQHCDCPNNVTCPTSMEDIGRRSILRVFRSKGEIIRARMDYCNLTLPSRKCNKNEPAFTLQGNGPFMLEMYGDFNCYCKRQLFAHKSWSEGMFNFIEYSCGKPMCHRLERGRDNSDAICMTITNTRAHSTFVPYLRHQYTCRCRYYEECVVVGELPVLPNQTAHAYCQNIFPRKLHKLH